MKNVMMLLTMTLTLSAFANIEDSPLERSHITPEEVNSARSCFQELVVMGCGDPGEEPVHFRNCLKNVYPSLTPDCARRMRDLYGN